MQDKFEQESRDTLAELILATADYADDEALAKAVGRLVATHESSQAQAVREAVLSELQAVYAVLMASNTGRRQQLATSMYHDLERRIERVAVEIVATSKAQIHHKDGDPRNNDLKNVEIQAKCRACDGSGNACGNHHEPLGLDHQCLAGVS